VRAGLKRGSIPKLLQRLKEKGCVRQVETGPQKGRYFVEDPLFVEYVRGGWWYSLMPSEVQQVAENLQSVDEINHIHPARRLKERPV